MDKFEYESMDKKALHDALLKLHTCPNCRGKLRPVTFFDSNVVGCANCKETWCIEEQLCPICGEPMHITGKTTDNRLIGSCGDAFTFERLTQND